MCRLHCPHPHLLRAPALGQVHSCAHLLPVRLNWSLQKGIHHMHALAGNKAYRVVACWQQVNSEGVSVDEQDPQEVFLALVDRSSQIYG